MSDPLRERQLFVLATSTVEAESSGLLGRYNQALEECLHTLVDGAFASDDPYAEQCLSRAEKVLELIGASALIGFNLAPGAPGNMVGSLGVLLVDVETRIAIPGSEVGITSACGPSYQRVLEPFTLEDVAYAVGRLPVQRDAGLIYRLPGGGGSGYLSEY